MRLELKEMGRVTTTAKIARLLGPRELVFEEEELDSAKLCANEILAETLVSAISVGTEVAAYAGDPPLRPGPVYPRLVGYCNVAKVAAVGEEVDGIEVADRILTFQSHRSAFICPADKVVLKLPESADIKLASLTYLFHLGYNALLKGGFVPGQNVGVIGLGTLGLGAVALAAASGGRVAAVSGRREALDLAMKLGASISLEKGSDLLGEEYQTWAGEIGVDLIITTSNRWEDWRLALELAGREGTIAVLGFPGRGQPEPDFNPLDSRYFYDKQLKLVACGMSPDLEVPPHEIRFTVKRNCAYLLEQILSGRLPTERLIDGVHSWTELAGVYEELADRRGPGLTRVLDWQGA